MSSRLKLAAPPRDTSNWRPQCLGDIVGNRRLKEYLSRMIHSVRLKSHRAGWNLLLTGGSRSGKTSSLSFGLQALACQNLDFPTLTPCRTCPSCAEKHHVHGDLETAWHSRLLSGGERTTPIEVHICVANGPSLTLQNVDTILSFMRREEDGPKVAYVDEIFRLDHRVAETLLSPMDRYQGIWLASSAHLPTPARGQTADDRRKIYEMFRSRFDFRLSTESPTTAEMVPWLKERCKDLAICVADSDTVLSRVAEESGRIPGRALLMLNYASKMCDSVLTDQVIDECARADDL